MEKDNTYVAYYRVSTKKQGVSGLGLEAQQETVRRFAGNNPIAYHFTEIESGKSNNRPQLKKAIEKCKRFGYTLLIAKLDRLARRVSFVSALMDSDVDFIAADIPHANKLTIHLMAAIAEQEAEMIAKRTKGAAEAKKRRGEVWGLRKTAAPGSERAREIARMGGRANARLVEAPPDHVLELLRLYRKEGQSFDQLKASMEAAGFKYAKSTIHKMYCKYILKRKRTKVRKEIKPFTYIPTPELEEIENQTENK